MDRLERRLIQLKIEREAVKKDTTDAAIKQVELLDEHIDAVQKEFADLEEVWTAEKAAVRDLLKSRVRSSKPNSTEAAHRAGDLARV